MSSRIELRPTHLKDFQQATVDHVFRRMYEDSDPTSRFLIADEVGLGKTLCARGLIARSIDHLQRAGVKRIDVIYVCSNIDIARQNIARLNPTHQDDFHLAGRITLLPLHLKKLAENPVNLVSFTPGTSLDLKSTTGTVEERAVLYWLLRRAWGAHAVTGVGARRLLAVDALGATFEHHVARIRGQLDTQLSRLFVARLSRESVEARDSGREDLEERFAGLRRSPARRAEPRHAERSARRLLIGELRDLLAEVCVAALEPDLIILDEFQRFKKLLDVDNPAGDLAQQLFQYDGARVLLLSATPYKMYTVSEDVADDHYTDFIATLEFLVGRDEAQVFRGDLRAYREALLAFRELGLARARATKRVLEEKLRRVMVRTERLSSTADRNGMLVERPCEGLTLDASDIRSYVALDALAQRLGAGDVLEYWKSTPYLLNFMEEYVLARAVEDPASQGVSIRDVTKLVRAGVGVIPWEAFERFGKIEPGNPAMRSLVHDTIESGAWRLLWIPPSLDYYEPGPPYNDPKIAGFTKRLLFSSWTVVPKAVASMLSYEAERRVMSGRGRRNTAEAREKVRPLLQFARSKGRLTGMPALALVYPSAALAALADPRVLARELVASGTTPSIAAVVELARDRVSEALAPMLADAREDGQADDRWYVVGQCMLDRLHPGTSENSWAGRPAVASAWTGEGETAERSALADHVREAHALSSEGPGQLGRPPDDLVDVIARIVLAAPGVTALRAMGRIGGGPPSYANDALRCAAARIAWGFRGLFNTPEARKVVARSGAGAYWRRTLTYTLNGNLQAVLDEYAHVLVEWLGLTDRAPGAVVAGVAETMYEALALRRVGYVARDVSTRDGERRFPRRRMPGRFALRFSDEAGDDGKAVNRRASVHRAFNSPFWPFVLASTSVGQEGLDFHLYSHAVMHWNLPANPVDLEQREGRVHRYKGHAVRKNIALACRSAAAEGDDPWESLFAAAAAQREAGQSEIMPSWVYTTDGGAQIERYVPALPLSRDKSKLRDLKRGLVLYRLAFGQPRQEDLVEYLRQHFDEAAIVEMLDEFRIDLSPPAG